MSLPFFLNDTATTEIYTLSLHDALPILKCLTASPKCAPDRILLAMPPGQQGRDDATRSTQGVIEANDGRSEEHTSELQSRRDLVCRLLLEKKKKKKQCSIQSDNSTNKST